MRKPKGARRTNAIFNAGMDSRGQKVVKGKEPEFGGGVSIIRKKKKAKGRDPSEGESHSVVFSASLRESWPK